MKLFSPGARLSWALFGIHWALGLAAFVVQATTSALITSSVNHDPILATMPLGALVATAGVGVVLVWSLKQFVPMNRVYRLPSVLGLCGAGIQLQGQMSDSTFLLVVGSAAQGLSLSATVYHLASASLSTTFTLSARFPGLLLVCTCVVAGAPFAAYLLRNSLDDRFAAGLVLVTVAHAVQFVLSFVVRFDTFEQACGTNDPHLPPMRKLQAVFWNHALWLGALAHAVAYAVVLTFACVLPIRMAEEDRTLFETVLVLAVVAAGLLLPALLARLLRRVVPAYSVCVVGLLVAGIGSMLVFELVDEGLLTFLAGAAALGVGWNLTVLGASSVITKSLRVSERELAQTWALSLALLLSGVCVGGSASFLDGLGWRALLFSFVGITAFAVLCAALWICAFVVAGVEQPDPYDKVQDVENTHVFCVRGPFLLGTHADPIDDIVATPPSKLQLVERV